MPPALFALTVRALALTSEGLGEGEVDADLVVPPAHIQAQVSLGLHLDPVANPDVRQLVTAEIAEVFADEPDAGPDRKALPPL